jgi:uncharacterized protein involved in exopolysaccharide biosynthesis
VFASLVKERTRVFAWVLSGAVVGTTIALLMPNQYTSTAVFIARGSTSLSLPTVLQGAAVSLGLDRSNDYSPTFYADLLTSRPVLLSAVLHQYNLPDAGGRGVRTYLEIEGFSKESSSSAIESGLKHLAQRITTSADPRTNMITLSVRARYPQLSRDLGIQLLAALDSLNLSFRQAQSRDSREFYETRVMQTRGELDSADAAVRTFLQQNRVVTSPALQFEFQRLQREADLKRNLYGSVVQEYERARLQEARNVPALTILAQPFTPVKKSFPPRRLLVALGVLVGVVGFWAQLRVGAAMRRFRQEEPDDWKVLENQVRKVRRIVERSQ